MHLCCCSIMYFVDNRQKGKKEIKKGRKKEAFSAFVAGVDGC